MKPRSFSAVCTKDPVSEPDLGSGLWALQGLPSQGLDSEKRDVRDTERYPGEIGFGRQLQEPWFVLALTGLVKAIMGLYLESLISRSTKVPACVMSKPIVTLASSTLSINPKDSSGVCPLMQPLRISDRSVCPLLQCAAARHGDAWHRFHEALGECWSWCYFSWKLVEEMGEV